MENVKMDIAMLCAYTKLSTEALADKAGIDRNHLAAVEQGIEDGTHSELVYLGMVQEE